MNADPHKPLRDDVRLLGELLGETVKRFAGEEVFDVVERARALAKSGRAGNERAFSELADELARMSLDEALPIARAFAQFLHLANIAEQHHRVRRRRAYQRDPDAPPQRGSCDDSFARLLAAGISPDALARSGLRAADRARADRAPDRGRAPALVQKHNRIAAALAARDRPDLTPSERERSAGHAPPRDRDVRGQTERGPRAASRRRSTRCAAVSIVFEQSLWDAVPRFLRECWIARSGQHRPWTADRRRAAALRVVDRR